MSTSRPRLSSLPFPGGPDLESGPTSQSESDFAAAVKVIAQRTPWAVDDLERKADEVTYLSRVQATLTVLSRALREKLGLSQARLAQLLAVHISAIHRIESGAQLGINSEAKANLLKLCKPHPELHDIFSRIEWPKRGHKPGTY